MLPAVDLEAAGRRAALLARTLKAQPAMAGGGPLTTHVLDTSSGAPAEGMRLELFEGASPDRCVAERVCNSDGRVARLLPGDVIRPGVYMIRFYTAEYFATRGAKCFYPHCDIVFEVEDSTSHYHVPLILSPFGYSTYRGS